MTRLFYALPLLLLAACNANADAEATKLSGRTVSKTFNAGAFDKVSLQGPDNVVVRVGPAIGITATGDSALIDRLKIEVEDDQLKIGRIDRNGALFGSRGQGAVTVTVTLPALAAASVVGSGNMSVDRAAGGMFVAVVTGSGDLRIGQLTSTGTDVVIGGSGDLTLDRVETGPIKMAIAGSGNLSATGRADNASLSIAGSGDIRAARLDTRTAKASIAGSGNIAVGARERADVSILGSGDVDIHGTATCTTSKMGSGTIRCNVAG